jgi:hypothetical protein
MVRDDVVVAAGADDPSHRRWDYDSTWIRSESGDGVRAHLDKQADAGWELVSANTIQFFLPPDDRRIITNVIRYYFFWKRPFDPSTKQKRRAKLSQPAPGQPVAERPPTTPSRCVHVERLVAAGKLTPAEATDLIIDGVVSDEDWGRIRNLVP